MCAFLQHRQPDNTIMEADPKYSRSLEQDKETLLSDICIPLVPFPSTGFAGDRAPHQELIDLGVRKPQKSHTPALQAIEVQTRRPKRAFVGFVVMTNGGGRCHWDGDSSRRQRRGRNINVLQNGTLRVFLHRRRLLRPLLTGATRLRTAPFQLLDGLGGKTNDPHLPAALAPEQPTALAVRAGVRVVVPARTGRRRPCRRAVRGGWGSAWDRGGRNGRRRHGAGCARRRGARARTDGARRRTPRHERRDLGRAEPDDPHLPAQLPREGPARLGVPAPVGGVVSAPRGPRDAHGRSG